MRRTTKKDRWYLWQIFDQSGGSQVGPFSSCISVSINDEHHLFFAQRIIYFKASSYSHPQISVVVDGAKKVVEFSFEGLQKTTLRYTFKSRDLHVLFDRQWHKLSISVQSNIVSIYIDCKLVERRLTDERDSIDPSGRTLITTRVEDGRPVDVCSTIHPWEHFFFILFR